MFDDLEADYSIKLSELTREILVGGSVVILGETILHGLWVAANSVQLREVSAYSAFD